MLGRYIDLGSPVERAHPLNRGLVSWWLPLPNNAGGGTLFDIAGVNHGTLTNGPTWTAGPGGPALLLDGSNDYVAVGNVAALDPTAAITVAAYVRWTASGGSDARGVVSKGHPGLGTGWMLGLKYLDNGKPTWEIQTGGTWRSIASTVDANNGAWRLLVGVYDGANTYLYVDGVQRATTAATGAIGTTAYGVQISAWESSITANTVFAGSVAHASVHNRALAADDVRALYDQSLRGHPDTLRRMSRTAWLLPAQAAGGSPVSVTPTTAALTLTTFAPTVSTPRLCTPSTLALTATRYAPVIALAVIPPTRALTLTTFAPTVSTPRVCTPTTKALALTSYAPVIALAVTPSTRALTLTTFAPTVQTPRVCTPTTASLTLSVFAPTVPTPRTVTPSTASLTLTGYAPAVQAPRTVTPSTLALATTGYAPSITVGARVTPTTRALTLTTYAPTVSTPRIVTPTTLTLTLAMYAPTVTAGSTPVPRTIALTASRDTTHALTASRSTTHALAASRDTTVSLTATNAEG